MANKTKQAISIDVLEAKKAELNAYQTQFDDAISVVTGTIGRLAEINDGIVQKIDEIARYQDELEKTRVGLADTKNKNECVIKNFSALLSTD